MLNLAVFAISAAVFIASPALAADTEVYGRAKWEMSHETDSGDRQKNEQSIDLEAKSYISDNLSLKAIVRALHETNLEADNRSDVDLREFYLDLAGDRGKLRLGRQQVVWGKTDGLRLLDLINPQDFREFILDDFIDSRIPLWMARGDYYIEDDTFQILLIPDVRLNKTAGSGDRFEPLFLKKIRSSPMLESKSPSTHLSNSEFGLRYSGFTKGWDYSLNYFYSWEDNPLYFSENISGTMTKVQKNKRLTMLGGALSRAFGSFVLRGEAALNMGRYFSTTDPSHPDGQVQKDELRAAIGLDYSSGNWGISGQIFETLITGYEDGILNDRLTTRLSLMITRDLFNETLRFKLLNIFGTNDSDNLGRFSATYSINDRWKVMGGIALFNGPASSFFGQFGDADRAELELTYSF